MRATHRTLICLRTTEKSWDCCLRRFDCEKVQNAVSIMSSVNCASINPSELFLFPNLASVGSLERVWLSRVEQAHFRKNCASNQGKTRTLLGAEFVHF